MLVTRKGSINFLDHSIIALYAPSFRLSLASVSLLTRWLNFTIRFQNSSVLFYKQLKNYGQGYLDPSSNLFFVDIPDPVEIGTAAITSRQVLGKNRKRVFRYLSALIRKKSTTNISNPFDFEEFEVSEKLEFAHAFTAAEAECPDKRFETRQLGLNRTRSMASFTVWHRRLGHIAPEALQKILIQNKDKVTTPLSTRELESFFCEACVKAKMQQRMGRNNQIERSLNPFERVHADVCGPFPVPALGGSKYYVVFIDDHSRFPEVRTLVHKSDVLNAWKDYRIRHRNMSYPIVCLRSDNGGEFQMLLKDCKEQGIVWEPSPPYTQHANGVAERMIRSLNTKARSWLLDSKLPDYFWGEAICHAALVHSLIPQKRLENKSPHEIRFGKTPPIKHIRGFGSLCFRWLHPAQRVGGKWATKAHPSMVLGLATNSKTVYRVWDFVKLKIYEASNLSFREDIQAFPNYGSQDPLFGSTSVDLFGGYYENFEDIPEIEGGLRSVSTQSQFYLILCLQPLFGHI